MGHPLAPLPIVSTNGSDEAEYVLSRELTPLRLPKVQVRRAFHLEMNGRPDQGCRGAVCRRDRRGPCLLRRQGDSRVTLEPCHPSAPGRQRRPLRQGRMGKEEGAAAFLVGLGGVVVAVALCVLVLV